MIANHFGHRFARCVSLLASFMLLLFSYPLRAQNLPPGTTLEARLLTPTGSRISQPGDQIEATIIAPISFHGQILVPLGSGVIGSVESVKKFGFGLKQTTASIHYNFAQLRLPNGDLIPIQTELIEVENAKERVDVDSTVRGIHPVASLSSSLDLVTTPLLFVTPVLGAPVWGEKSIIAPAAVPEIYFPPGTELILRLTAPASLRSNVTEPIGIASFSPDEDSNIHHLLTHTAQRAVKKHLPSDFVNLVFLGSREEMDRAFRAAGWGQAERKSPLSLFRMYHALAERVGYERAPMDTLLLNGVPSDFVYQKCLDTVQKRHHVRLWKEPHQANVWLGTAAEDIAFRFEVAHWTHATAPYIDRERAKVVNDFAYTGCLDTAGLVTRDPADLRTNSGKARPIQTDGNIAVLRLNDCTHPTAMPGGNALSNSKSSSRLSREFTSLRNGLRMNVFFTAYNSLRLLATRRNLKPLRTTPSSDLNPPGLEWLNSLSPRRQAPLLSTKTNQAGSVK